MLALAEMYVQDVSTRKVAAIAEQLRDVRISSSQVSQAAAALGADLKTRQEKSLGDTPYLILDALSRFEEDGNADPLLRQGFGTARPSFCKQPERNLEWID